MEEEAFHYRYKDEFFEEEILGITFDAHWPKVTIQMIVFLLHIKWRSPYRSILHLKSKNKKKTLTFKLQFALFTIIYLLLFFIQFFFYIIKPQWYVSIVWSCRIKIYKRNELSWSNKYKAITRRKYINLFNTNLLFMRQAHS